MLDKKANPLSRYYRKCTEEGNILMKKLKTGKKD